ncbi:Sulfite reductase [ferredoxin] [Pirellulimonas nuda]|uniref:Sulfite reductase [ferredoxin] n=1 Tax=Pirellulimonas nuda TaxID=2528009 RepID=A0A518DH85_9BACT|nr:NADPH-dependent assimilatory sulfite reductase hemoprotein subunit [Pirellulimonas nuda]QDU90838.1 Sulfite reductase [ferredoxin] [Pirellulimonas nuda]
MSDEPAKLSAVEGVKLESHYLRGTIAAELANDAPNFDKDTTNVLKHHGTYEQDDRDRRAEARAAKVPGGKFFSMMIRSAIPGGRLTSAQLLAQLDLCDQVGNGTLRITTRQGLQLHGVLKENLKQVIRGINESQLTTLAACGDVKRNVMCSPAPYKTDPVYDQMQRLADELTAALNPKTTAYYEIWLTDSETGEKALAGSGGPGANGSGGYDVEPIYGQTYLPRKFKIGVSLPGDNSCDVYAQDLGFLAICEGGQIVGYNVLVGGSFGVTPSADKTFAAIGQEMCYVPASQAVDIAIAVVKVQRDFGNRSDRKVARMKYLIHNWGLDRFTSKVEEYFGAPLEAPRDAPVTGYNDCMGWHEQGDGRWFYGLNVENGRIKDEGDFRLKSALREVCQTLAPPLRLTPHQSAIFCDIQPQDRDKLESILRSHGVPLSDQFSTVRRWSMACPALPLCGLAVTESERVMPGIMDQLEPKIAALGLQDEVFTTRMTGCPNGCARPYNADIGLVGKTKGKFTIFLGGHTLGHRLNWIYKDLVPEDQVVDELTAVLRVFASERSPGETLGDFCHRVGKDELIAMCEAEPVGPNVQA